MRMRRAVRMWMCALALATAPQLAAGAKRKRTAPTPLTRGDVRAVDTSVLERGLTEERELSTTRVLAEHGHYHADVNRRNFNGTVLGYVTPWNARGYEIAKRFRGKLSHIAPVWFQLRGAAHAPEITGRQDVDLEWIHAVRGGSPEECATEERAAVRVVPRVVVELGGQEQIQLLRNEAAAAMSVEVLVSLISQYELDGLTLEVWPSWERGGILQPQYGLRANAIAFVRSLAERLHQLNAELVLVMAPSFADANSLASVQAATEFDELLRPASAHIRGDPVDLFSLMTYDFSHAGRPGPSAPLDWVRQNVQRLLDRGARLPRAPQSVLVGLNFFGNDFGLPQGGGPILGHEFLSLLEREQPSGIAWDAVAAEHVMSYSSGGQQHRVWFPSPTSVLMRLQLAASQGSGVAIWELGQGLDYLMDVL